MNVPPGLCGRCAWAQLVPTARGSAFVRCGHSDHDPRYRRYPTLPVLQCEAFQQTEASRDSAATAEPVGGPPLVPQRSVIGGIGALDRRSLFERVGGRNAVEQIIDALYDRIEADPELRPLFPEDLGAGRAKQQLFFEEWLGGEPRYTQRQGSPRLRQRHLPFLISRRAAERWVEHMRAALGSCGVDPAVAGEIMRGLQPLALHFVNRPDPASQTDGASPA